MSFPRKIYRRTVKKIGAGRKQWPRYARIWGPDLAVVLPIVLGHHLGLTKAVQHLDDEELATERAVERFNGLVLPG